MSVSKSEYCRSKLQHTTARVQTRSKHALHPRVSCRLSTTPSRHAARIEQCRLASTLSRVAITLSEPHSNSGGVHRGIGTICSSRGACPHLLYRSKSSVLLTPTYTTQITQPRHRPSDTAGKRDRHPKATKLASTPPPRMPADRAIMRCWRLWRKLLKFFPSVATSGSRMPICGYESYHEHSLLL